ncbi:DUF2877 domain-containing protein [Ruegeria sp. THAF57]|uniref:DUF2877 domain-containing protein n=1 Tax=Ruegeria sp. THAF57 TaxID=2744555 RepID=UPI0015DE2659|nr:DUF2877 domain-containing protein [Ruegeria sp. THAF57]
MTLTAAYPEVSPVYLADTVGDGVPVAHEGSALNAEVIATFSSGFYVKDEKQRIFAVGSPAIPAGPLHLVLKHAPPKPNDGTPVTIRSNALDIGPVSISLKSATRFSPFNPRPGDLALAIPVLAGLYKSRNIPQDILPVFAALTSALHADDLDGARNILQGRGDGLTPSGDDVLAGLLLFHAWSGRPVKDLLGVALNAKTNDLSRAFLKWTARGQSIQPVHDLIRLALKLSLEIRPLPAQRLKSELMRAVDDLSRIGHSSGVALLTGLSLAARLYWRPINSPETPQHVDAP